MSSICLRSSTTRTQPVVPILEPIDSPESPVVPILDPIDSREHPAVPVLGLERLQGVDPTTSTGLDRLQGVDPTATLRHPFAYFTEHPYAFVSGVATGLPARRSASAAVT